MSQAIKLELIVDDKGSVTVKQFGKNLEEVSGKGGKSVKGLSGAMDDLKGRFTPLTGLVTKLGIAFGAWKLAGVAKGFLDTSSSMETYSTTLGTVLKSTERAGEMMEWIRDFAASTPFEIPGLVEAATRLEAYGLDAQKYG
jgi:phage tail tape-measure protein